VLRITWKVLERDSKPGLGREMAALLFALAAEQQGPSVQLAHRPAVLGITLMCGTVYKFTKVSKIRPQLVRMGIEVIPGSAWQKDAPPASPATACSRQPPSGPALPTWPLLLLVRGLSICLGGLTICTRVHR
jgi:hypothetical protein